MIIKVQDSIFNSPAKFLVNPVNCVGIMGAGLAREFRTWFPEMYDIYRAECRNDMLKLGKPSLWRNPDKHGKHVINFPTKDHFHDKSDLRDIVSGLNYMVEKEFEWGIVDYGTVAFPALGCGLGGIDIRQFELVLNQYFDGPPDSGWTVYYHVPRSQNDTRRMEQVRTQA